MARTFIGLGSNLGDRFLSLCRAIYLIAQFPQSTLTNMSGIYQTEPVGKIDQPDFLNAVVILGSQPRRDTFHLGLAQREQDRPLLVLDVLELAGELLLHLLVGLGGRLGGLFSRSQTFGFCSRAPCRVDTWSIST